jgi:hypothetical protein
MMAQDDRPARHFVRSPRGCFPCDPRCDTLLARGFHPSSEETHAFI